MAMFTQHPPWALSGLTTFYFDRPAASSNNLMPRMPAAGDALTYAAVVVPRFLWRRICIAAVASPVRAVKIVPAPRRPAYRPFQQWSNTSLKFFPGVVSQVDRLRARPVGKHPAVR
jgi:hypothetical protein